MLTTIPFPDRIHSDRDDRVRGYVEEMNEIVRRCQERGVETLGGIIDYEPEHDAEPALSGLEFPPFVLLDEQPDAVLEYPANRNETPSAPAVATFEEQLVDLSARRRVAEAA